MSDIKPVKPLDTPKSNLVIHSKRLPHNEVADRKNFYETREGKRTIKEGLEHQANVSGDANDINRGAHAEFRGPNDAEIGGFLDRLENKHGKRSLIKKASRRSSTVASYVMRNGKIVPINEKGVEVQQNPSRRIRPAWK